MNGFTKKTVGTLTLGEKLKIFREERRISLNDASRYTKIQAKYLEFLENGEYEKLPAEVYVKGFLKKYADFLGVDERLLLKTYEKERGIRKNIKKEKEQLKEIKPLNISFFVFTPQKILSLLGIILVLSVIFFIYREVGSFASAPRLVILSPEQNLETENRSIEVQGIAEKDARIFINNQLVLAGDDGKFKETVSLQPGSNTINIKAVNKFEKETTEIINVSARFSNENQDINGDLQENLEKVNLEVSVDPGPVWVSVEVDGNLSFSGNMSSGATQKFSAKEKIVLESNRANVTFVKLNGRDFGALSPKAVAVKEVIFEENTTAINLVDAKEETLPQATVEIPEKKKKKK